MIREEFVDVKVDIFICIFFGEALLELDLAWMILWYTIQLVILESIYFF